MLLQQIPKVHLNALKMSTLAIKLLVFYTLVAVGYADVSLAIIKDDTLVTSPIRAKRGTNLALSCKVMESGVPIDNQTIWGKRTRKSKYEPKMMDNTLSFMPLTMNDQGEYFCISLKFQLFTAVNLMLDLEKRVNSFVSTIQQSSSNDQFMYEPSTSQLRTIVKRYRRDDSDKLGSEVLDQNKNKPEIATFSLLLKVTAIAFAIWGSIALLACLYCTIKRKMCPSSQFGHYELPSSCLAIPNLCYNDLPSWHEADTVELVRPLRSQLLLPPPPPPPSPALSSSSLHLSGSCHNIVDVLHIDNNND